MTRFNFRSHRGETSPRGPLFPGPCSLCLCSVVCGGENPCLPPLQCSRERATCWGMFRKPREDKQVKEAWRNREHCVDCGVLGSWRGMLDGGLVGAVVGQVRPFYPPKKDSPPPISFSLSFALP